MDHYQEPVQRGEAPEFGPRDTKRSLAIAVVALAVTAGTALGYAYHQHSLVRELNTQVSTSNSQMTVLQNQVSALNAKLNQLTAAQPAPAAVPAAPVEPSNDTATVAAAEAPQTPAPSAAAAPPTPAKTTHAKHAAGKKHPPVDTKYTKLQAQLDEQAKELKETEQAVEKNRTDLEGNISSTRDELNGSIAKTHEELVVLEKRGERSYFEFDLSKSKQFQRVGPLTLSLRKADTKHKSFDLAMIVDDNELNKKKVNLYEPIWIHTESAGQPIQIVVNRIDKDLVHGYISAPKYKPSELAAAGGASVTPVSTKAAPSGATNPVDQPPQPRQ
jgi:chaperonin cofactor prefoldin